MNSVLGADEVRNTVQGIDLPVSAARPKLPSVRRGIRMSVELADHDRAGKARRAAQVDARLPACDLAANRDLSGRDIHVDPAALLVASSGIIRQGILPGLVECVPDRRIIP
jgi:hypothetical protein